MQQMMSILRAIQSDVASNKNVTNLMVSKLEKLEGKTDEVAKTAEEAKSAAEQAIKIATEAKETAAATRSTASFPSTRPASSAAAPAAAAPASSPAFVPQVVNLQGFIKDWADPDVSAVLNTEAPGILRPILDKLADYQKNLVDFDRTLAVPFRPFLNKLPVVVSEPVSRDKTYRLKFALQQVLTKHPSLAEIGGQPVHFAVPADADRRALYKQGSLWHRAMEHHHIAKEHYIIEYLGKTSLKAFLKKPDEPRPVRVASYDSK
eukprot:7498135-Lingulodinium_polyedra.AAC.1